MISTIVNTSASVVTMTSREIAELTGKHHQHVRRDILKMFVELDEDVSKFGRTYSDSMNREQYEYVLDRELTETLLTGYSAKLRRAVIARWRELEAKQAAPVALSTMDILTLAIESEKGRLLALEQRDHAIATKAHIGSKREATAMATASAAKKESSALKEQLGFCANFATVTAVQNATGEKFDWLPLRRWCKEHHYTPTDVQDKRYGTVKAWPAGAWANVFGVDLMDLFGEVAA